ncbi:PEPxxWA-CTERM sorting domain-containing protein [Sandarakinorhabdus sp. DWP1-3-1]|uniref:PEPxxWA-CTERM sorting domain-containing protein n=1 Tax=Sandarakinorhabdus sp. DWP1-3-1 TaxID=2804627 RepID=UPI003CF70946
MKSLLPAVIAVAFATPAAATVIDFESQPSPIGTLFVEGDYRFVANVSAGILTSSGSKALFAPNPFMPPFANSIALSRIDGGSFSLTGLDVFAADSNGLGVPLTFIGTLAAGGTTSFTVNLPEFGPGAAIPSTRVAVDFGSSFAAVTEVRWSNGAEFHQVDNLVVAVATAAVPEPASWALLIAGFGMTGAALRRRRPVPSPG